MNWKTLFFSLILLAFTACEKEISIKLNPGSEQLVVEGHIETNLPPYVILTRSTPFFASVSVNDLSKIFVHNALISVTDGINTVFLKEYSSDLLPSYITDFLSRESGVKIASAQNQEGIKVSVYLPTDTLFLGQIGRTYSLKIEVEGKQLTAITSIPQPPILDSIWVTPHPSIDTLVTLNVRISDPAGVDNFVRYFTQRRLEPFYPPYFQSVLDDKSIFDVDGKTFEFPIERGHNRNSEINFETFTYFNKNDTINVRWCAIDREHFDFWSTAEFDKGSGGNPFSSPITIKSNIHGGLGIWGGYSPVYKRWPYLNNN